MRFSLLRKLEFCFLGYDIVCDSGVVIKVISEKGSAPLLGGNINAANNYVEYLQGF
jgi:hypothetical protein